MADELVSYVKEMNFTHVELMPVMEYPYDPSWGYQLTGYFAPTSRFGYPEEFKLLVDKLHQNDIGIMGSIPSHLNRDILATWMEKMPEPQDQLVDALLKALPNKMPTQVDEHTKKDLAKAVRKHYKKYPEALSMQASGEIIPPTVDNHK